MPLNLIMTVLILALLLDLTYMVCCLTERSTAYPSDQVSVVEPLPTTHLTLVLIITDLYIEMVFLPLQITYPSSYVNCTVPWLTWPATKRLCILVIYIHIHVHMYMYTCLELSKFAKTQAWMQ